MSKLSCLMVLNATFNNISVISWRSKQRGQTSQNKGSPVSVSLACLQIIERDWNS